tara:strand:+ start:9097 stop:9492 length:396 start_codon:yes stop_codon:yes gene_type:complete
MQKYSHSDVFVAMKHSVYNNLSRPIKGLLNRSTNAISTRDEGMAFMLFAQPLSVLERLVFEPNIELGADLEDFIIIHAEDQSLNEPLGPIGNWHDNPWNPEILSDGAGEYRISNSISVLDESDFVWPYDLH